MSTFHQKVTKQLDSNICTHQISQVVSNYLGSQSEAFQVATYHQSPLRILRISKGLQFAISTQIELYATVFWIWQYNILANEAVELSEGGWRSALSLKTGQLLISQSASFQPKINLIMSLFASDLK